MVLAMSVAVATLSSSGTINDRSRPVSSIIRTTAESGPCVVAARTAAAMPAPIPVRSTASQKPAAPEAQG
jgi:hypothetical protein